MWAMVSSWFCFCWFYRASPSSAANNIINVILVLTIFWLPTFAFQSLVMKRTPLLGVRSGRSCKVIIEPFNFSFFGVSAWGKDLDYCDVEWFALETNRDHSVIFEIAPKFCISDSLVDYKGYSISCKGFLPKVEDIMVIWIKFTHSCLF